MRQWQQIALPALYEAYPLGTDVTTSCRLYFLVVLNAAGQLVAAQQVSDPFLDVCSHRHPYGVAADADGNLYVAFSYSVSNATPLVPRAPMLLVSFRSDATIRWRVLEPTVIAGELSTAAGRLFSERNTYAYAARNGERSAELGHLGRVVATGQTFIQSPVQGGTQLTARRLTTLQSSWTHALPLGDEFVSDQIRLGVWHSLISQRPEATALTFLRHGDQLTLLAINAERGWQTWRCPVIFEARGTPQLFEVADGYLGLMEGAQTCGQCDPPYAGSRAAFHLLAAPGLEASQEPWPGAFGGPSHDHREKPGVSHSNGESELRN